MMEYLGRTELETPLSEVQFLFRSCRACRTAKLSLISRDDLLSLFVRDEKCW